MDMFVFVMVGALTIAIDTGSSIVSRRAVPVPAAFGIVMPTCNGVPVAKSELGVPVITPVFDNDNPSVAHVVPSGSNPK